MAISERRLSALVARYQHGRDLRLKGSQHASGRLRHGHGSYDPGDCVHDSPGAAWRNRFKVTAAEARKPATVRVNSIRGSLFNRSPHVHPTDSHQDDRNHLKSSLSPDRQPLCAAGRVRWESSGLAVKYISADRRSSRW